MLVKTTTRQAGDVTILDVAGRVTLGPTATEFGGKIRQLSAEGHKKIVLNLAELVYLDSSGIGELVASFSSVAKAGGQMRLLSPQKRVEEILAITNVNSLFQTFSDEAAAVASFAP